MKAKEVTVCGNVGGLDIFTPYYVDYIYEPFSKDSKYYYQLVRIADNAILYANEDIKNVLIRCWESGICPDSVTIL